MISLAECDQVFKCAECTGFLKEQKGEKKRARGILFRQLSPKAPGKTKTSTSILRERNYCKT